MVSLKFKIYFSFDSGQVKCRIVFNPLCIKKANGDHIALMSCGPTIIYTGVADVFEEILIVFWLLVKKDN
jgi:hypothetical protein